MKFLFVVKSKKMENLGVMYLAAILKNNRHEARIVDINFNQVEFVESWKPDVIGYSIMTGDMEKFKVLNRVLKKKAKFVSVVGGPDPTFFPDGYKWADEVVRGEAENWIAEYVKLNEKYNSLDSIPWPDRSDFKDFKIRDFIASRGCPNSCSYCFNERWNSLYPDIAKVRMRSVDDVVSEINHVANITDNRFVYFQDSCFGVNMKWMKEFSKKYRNKINLPFHCHLRPNQINEERVLLLLDAGCMSIRIALESASDKLRKVLNRGKMDIYQVRESSRLLKKWGIKLMIQNMLGIPTSTIEDDLETLEVNIRSKPTYSWCSIFQPYPGTRLGDWCKESGWYKGDYGEIGDNFFDTSVLEFDEVYKEQVEVLQKVFALCVEMDYMPDPKELKRDNLPHLVHKIMRDMGDRKLYGGLI